MDSLQPMKRHPVHGCGMEKRVGVTASSGQSLRGGDVLQREQLPSRHSSGRGSQGLMNSLSPLGETVLLIHLRASAGFQCNFIRSYYKVMNRFLSNVLDLTEASIKSTPFENPPHPPEPMTNLNPLSDIEYLRLGNRQ